MYRLFFVLIFLIATPVFAVDVANLYQFQQPVSSQSEEDRLHAAPAILKQVLLKVVGNRDTLEAVDLEPVLAQAKNFIQQYQYHKIKNVDTDSTDPEQLAVLLSFKQNLVDKALTNLGLPIWSKSRPKTLIWLTVNDGLSHHIVGANDQSILTQNIKAAAQDRGLPIVFPLMDLKDQHKVKVSDLSYGLFKPIEQASQRYGAPLILIIKANSTADTSQIKWQVLINGKTEQWRSRGEPTLAITTGMNELANRLGEHFSQKKYFKDYSEELTLHISNVHNYADYAHISNYLKGLQYVTDVQPSTIIADTIEVRVSFSGNVIVLNKNLAIDKVLIEEIKTVSGLNYRFSPP